MKIISLSTLSLSLLWITLCESQYGCNLYKVTLEKAWVAPDACFSERTDGVTTSYMYTCFTDDQINADENIVGGINLKTWNNNEDCSGDASSDEVFSTEYKLTAGDGIQCDATNCDYVKYRTYSVSSCTDGTTPAGLDTADYVDQLRVTDVCLLEDAVGSVSKSIKISYCNATGFYSDEYFYGGAFGSSDDDTCELDITARNVEFLDGSCESSTEYVVIQECTSGGLDGDDDGSGAATFGVTVGVIIFMVSLIILY